MIKTQTLLVALAMLAGARAGLQGGIGGGYDGGYGGGYAVSEGGNGGGHGGASSFALFHGPVAGPAHAVHGGYGGDGKHGHGGEYVDYVAYPKYDFAYGVEDHHTGDSHGQKEVRDGDKVVGEYTLKEPGGNVRTVKYHADKKGGFFATVINHGGNDHSGYKHGKAHSFANFHGPVVGDAHEVVRKRLKRFKR
ncbi:Cuticle protein 19 [Gryllus bimaculatus]|nr:Cuticle protein 19 [Gryllus bimaculatus]